MPTENQQDYDQLLESSSTTIDNQRKVVALLQSRLREEREEREKLEAQLAELEQNPVLAIDLPEPADLLNQLRGWLKKQPELAALLNQLRGRLKKQKKKLKTDEDYVEEILDILGVEHGWIKIVYMMEGGYPASW